MGEKYLDAAVTSIVARCSVDVIRQFAAHPHDRKAALSQAENLIQAAASQLNRLGVTQRQWRRSPAVAQVKREEDDVGLGTAAASEEDKEHDGPLRLLNTLSMMAHLYGMASPYLDDATGAAAAAAGKRQSEG